MPRQKDDKWKTLFADLGRPTLRGIRKCPKCGTVNGTRGNSCKNKSCDVVFRGNNNNGPRKKSNTDASQITNLPGCNEKVYSVRIRDRGPDFRSFVQTFEKPIAEQNDNSEDLKEDAPPKPSQQEFRCFVDNCKSKQQQHQQHLCSHILSVQKCVSEAQNLTLKQSVLSSLNIPSEHFEILSNLIADYPDLAVQRVSKSSFVVKSQQRIGPEDPIGFVHVMFMKPSKNEVAAENKAICSCKPIKTGDASTAVNSQSSTCSHYYACLCALVSDEDLATEFHNFIPQMTHEFSPPILSQLHLVACSQANEEKGVELDASLSVEIMQDNISLLESIAAGDDSTLGNVQGLEGVLSDQIIVTSVEDPLSFADPAVLDGLDDTDQQVCQIFANSDNSIQLTTCSIQGSTIAVSGDGSNSEIGNTISEDKEVRMQLALKRKKERNSFAQNSSSSGSTTVIDMQYTPSKKSLPITTATLTLVSNNGVTTLGEKESNSSGSKNSGVVVSGTDNQCLLWGFEHWLAGVNDRINSTMNYQLSPNPDPLVYYIPAEFFEKLKERIGRGGKKRLLPNQTLIFHRTDRSPLGTFTKHIWKITNILHIISIFNSSIVPLKTKQYFVKTNHGDFVEWVPPLDEDEKNQRIFPVLHSTFLKCGRNHESRTKENVPFVIEWVPDIFRDSRLGEMSLRLEFGKTGPIHEDEGHSWATKFTTTSIHQSAKSASK